MRHLPETQTTVMNKVELSVFFSEIKRNDKPTNLDVTRLTCRLACPSLIGCYACWFDLSRTIFGKVDIFCCGTSFRFEKESCGVLSAKSTWVYRCWDDNFCRFAPVCFFHNVCDLLRSHISRTTQNLLDIRIWPSFYSDHYLGLFVKRSKWTVICDRSMSQSSMAFTIGEIHLKLPLGLSSQSPDSAFGKRQSKTSTDTCNIVWSCCIATDSSLAQLALSSSYQITWNPNSIFKHVMQLNRNETLC